MKKPTILSSRFVETVRVPGRYGDGRGGHGLTLNVHPSENGRITRSWIQRIKINGRVTHIGLGAYPLVSLAEARKLALDNLMNVKKGIDPRTGIPTFSYAANEVIKINSEGWKDREKSEKEWRSSLRIHAYPKIGNMSVNEITTSDVMAVVLPIWNEKRRTAQLVRQRIGAVCNWAIAKGYRDSDPTGPALSAVLPKNGNVKKHHKALPYVEVAGALETIRASGAHWSTVACFEFLTLTATRSGEARLAQWDEINFTDQLWLIPGERMKAGRPHRVPLSRRAMEILADAWERTDGSGLVFPTARGKPLADKAISSVTRDNHIDCVPHGMRSSFRQWAAERTNMPSEVCELALAHVNKDRIVAAYQRSDMFDMRRKLMASWASYLAAEKAEVRAIR